ncbi:MAG: hypothetical protein AB1700_11740 [Bacillota bacterium]
MRAGVFFTIMPLPIGVAIYTASFGLWLLRQKNLRGAVGVFVTAAACVAAPALLLFLRG